MNLAWQVRLPRHELGSAFTGALKCHYHLCPQRLHAPHQTMSHVQLSMNQHVLNVNVSGQLCLDGITHADIIMLKPLLVYQLHSQAAVGRMSKPCKGYMDSTLCQAEKFQGTT